MQNIHARPDPRSLKTTVIEETQYIRLYGEGIREDQIHLSTSVRRSGDLSSSSGGGGDGGDGNDYGDVGADIDDVTLSTTNLAAHITPKKKVIKRTSFVDAADHVNESAESSSFNLDDTSDSDDADDSQVLQVHENARQPLKSHAPVMQPNDTSDLEHEFNSLGIGIGIEPTTENEKQASSRAPSRERKRRKMANGRKAATATPNKRTRRSVRSVRKTPPISATTVPPSTVPPTMHASWLTLLRDGPPSQLAAVRSTVETATKRLIAQLHEMLSESEERFGVDVELYKFLSFADSLRVAVSATAAATAQTPHHRPCCVTIGNSVRRHGVTAYFPLARRHKRTMIVRWFFATHLLAFVERFRQRFYAFLTTLNGNRDLRTANAGDAATTRSKFEQQETDGATYLAYIFWQQTTFTLVHNFRFAPERVDRVVSQFITDIIDHANVDATT